MKLKLVIAVILVAGPGLGQQRKAPAPRPTAARVQRVVQTISADKTKVEAYCSISKIQEQMAALDATKDTKKLKDLGREADDVARKLGPDFEKLMDGLRQVDQRSAEGRKFAAMLARLDAKCK